MKTLFLCIVGRIFKVGEPFIIRLRLPGPADVYEALATGSLMISFAARDKIFDAFGMKEEERIEYYL